MSAVPLAFAGVGKSFTTNGRRRAVLSDVSLEVGAGEIVALLGPSGCGKSTLLRLAGGLDQPGAGAVRVGERAVSGIEPRCAVVFQEPRLLPWRTIERNVAFGLPRGVTGEPARREVAHWLDVVGLSAFARHRPRQVSGGMAQRAALARALARRPGVLLLDEPFAALDALTRLKMQDLLADVQREAGTTVLLVTHDVDEALHLADRIVLLGAPENGAAATVRLVRDVPGGRPRDRGDAELAALRVALLGELGVHAPVRL
ncbi:ABC transporter ATP-binding protein [Actinoplanes sp. NPDC049596]|uniref:ABC transporter ATP-binding protein n=1 Tax=unclassified Actinoplanes TaxID=2626549 RepID=UPI0034130290